MKMIIVIILTAAGAGLLAGSGQARAAPEVILPPPDLPPPDAGPPPPAAAAPVPDLGGTSIGGYGELTFNKLEGTPAVVDLRRLVLYVGHRFSDRFRFVSEIEVEHAVASSDDRGEVEIEQAYLDWSISPRLNLRGGLVLMPVGIINQFHEPPTFNGVDRPEVDNLVIPSTWREPAVGVFGELAPTVHYQAYLVDGLDANGFTAESSIREGHQEAELARAGDFGAVARLDYEPILATVVGASVYYATAGNTLRATVGSVPVALIEADARSRLGRFRGRAEIAVQFIGDSRALTVFGRYDHVDTQAAVPSAFTERPEFRQDIATLGVTSHPIPEIALKLDGRHRWLGDGRDLNEIAAAITWMF